MKYIIGVDIGTSGAKAVAFTASGEVLADALVSYQPLPTEPGFHELDPEVLFQAVLDVIRTALSGTRSREGLSGICFSAAMHSLIAVDKNGIPLTHVITWADTRSKEQAIRLKNTPEGDRIYEKTGTPIHSMSPLCKIAWIREKQPVVFAKTGKFIGIKEFIWNRFFGKYLIDYSIASATGLFDIYRMDWFEEALVFAGITAEKLSRPRPTVYSESGIDMKYRIALGLSGEIPFIIGGSDGCLANLGTNAVLPGDVSLTIGTSGALRMISSTPKNDPEQRIFNYILTENHYVSGGAVNNGGVILQWYIKHFMDPSEEPGVSFSNRIEEAAAVPAGAEGLFFLPYLLGERAPIWNEDARGVFFGIHPKHNQRHFLRAVLEGISYSLFQVGHSLEETIGPIGDIYASGGFTQSECWLQLIADLFNKKVYLTSATDASAIGAAMLGFYARGIVEKMEDLQKIIEIKRVILPDPARSRLYRQYYPLFVSLYASLRESFSQLNRLLEETNPIG